MLTKSYKRGQVELAIWQLLNTMSNDISKPPKKYKTRIKRLLELDRSNQNDPTGFAFSDISTGGQGTDAQFSEFDTFCLAHAMDLLDIGFKQSEIVFLLRHIRSDLKKEYEQIMEFPPPVRQLVAPEDVPGKPTYKKGNMEVADLRVYVVIEKVEIIEAFTPSVQPTSGEPMIMKPRFCHGIEKLQSELDQMGYSYRKAMVFEISETAALIGKYLKEAPLHKRGRG